MNFSVGKSARGAACFFSLLFFALVVLGTVFVLLASFSPAFSLPISFSGGGLVLNGSDAAGEFSDNVFGVVFVARIALFTIFQAAMSLLIALAIGLPAAFFVARRRFFGRSFLLSLSSVPLCLPTLIMALGYVTFFGMSGIANRFLMALFSSDKRFLTFLYSFAGIIIAQGFYNFPLIMATVAESWARLPQNQADSARLLGAGEGRIFATVTFYQLLPSIISSSIPVFLYCFFSFMIVLLFGSVGGTTLEVQIYQAARSSLDFRAASLLALVETSIAVLILWAYSFLEKKAGSRAETLLSAPLPLKKIRGRWESLFFALAALLVVVFFLFPLAGIVFNACTTSVKSGVGSSFLGGRFSFSSFAKVVSSGQFLPALSGTLSTAFMTASFSTLMGFVYAVFLKIRERKSPSRFFKVVPMLPMAVSSVVMGFGLMVLFRRGNVIHLILAQTSLIWPFAFRQIYAQLSKLSDDTFDADRLLSSRISDSVFFLYFPYCLRGIISAWTFCFAFSAGDTALPLVLSLKDFNTLSLFTYRLAGRYKFHEACACGIILAVICAAFFAVSNKIKDGGRK